MPEHRFLVLRLDAPLMSFGGPVVDNYGVAQPFPAAALLTGLLANALGYDHRDADATTALQQRLVFASRADRRGQPLRDFQTVALGQPHLANDCAWTTRGRIEERAGASSEDTAIRYRDYWADAVHTVVLTLEPADRTPSLDAIAEALSEPERPLFIGRKPCLPAAPVFECVIDAANPYEALLAVPRHPRADTTETLEAWWPVGQGQPGPLDETLRVSDLRDWHNQVHVGQRTLSHGFLRIEERS